MDRPKRSAREPGLGQEATAPLLDADEESRLVRRAMSGDGDAVRRLVASHLRMVVKVARRYRGSGLAMADLVQEGVLGLVQALRRFDPDQGARLSTYARWWVRSSIQDYALRSWSVVRVGTSNAQKTLAFRLKQMTAELLDGAEDLSEEAVASLARRFGSTKAEVAALAGRLSKGDESIDRAWPDGPPLIDRMAADQPDPEEALAIRSEHVLRRNLVDRALAALPPREKIVIQRRYLDEAKHTFVAIGLELGVSKDRVRQLEARALTRLRDLLGPAVADLRL